MGTTSVQARKRLTPRRLRPAVKTSVIRLLPVIGFVALWWLLTATVLTRARIYPPPLLVWDELLRIVAGEGPLGSTYSHFLATVTRLSTAFVISFVVGTLLGVLAGRKKRVFDFLHGLMWISMAVPAVVWVFLFVIILGIGETVPITAISVLLIPIVYLGVAEGTKAVPSDLVVMAMSYKVGAWRRLRDLYLPSLVPYMAASARVAFALGIKAVIIAEVVGLGSGVGVLLKYWYDRLFMGPMIAWAIILIALGITLDAAVFGPLERRARSTTGKVTTSVAQGLE